MRAAGHSLAALGAAAAVPFAVGALALRPGWRVGWRERMGALPRRDPGDVWIHGASVGEILAASRLVDVLGGRGRRAFTSTFTVSGRGAMRRARPDVPCHLAPLDHPWCVEAALARVRPAVLVLIETELWPCWIAAAERRRIPVVLVSGRVSDRSFPRYRRLEWLVGATLRRLAAIGARTAGDADRFLALGASPASLTITGDLKVELPGVHRPLAPELENVLGAGPLVVAGSTHAGEATAVLGALAEIEPRGLAPALVLAPRHPARAREVERVVRASGRALRRRSVLGREELAPGEVLVLDTLGELAPLYARATVAFVGGTLVARGGHNILEPVAAGCPVVFGRHTANVRHAVDLLDGSGAARPVEDASGLGPAFAELLRDPAAARVRGGAGRRLLEGHRGSAGRSAALIERALQEVES